MNPQALPSWDQHPPVLSVEDSPISNRHVLVTYPGGARAHMTPAAFHEMCNVGSGTRLASTLVGLDG